MCLSAQQLQPLAGLRQGLDLVEERAIEIKRLIGADHQIAGPGAGDLDGLQFGKGVGDLARTMALRQQPGLHGALVHPGDLGFERHACGAEDRRAGRTLRCQNDHPRISTAPRPPDKRLMIAAAVSSTERRVTSMTGQPWRSNSRRAAMISSRTASWSM